MPKPLACGGARERRDEGEPFRIQKTSKRGASNPCCQTNKPNRIPRRRPRDIIDLSLRLGAIHFSQYDMAYNLAERLRPPKVNPMLTDLSHLRTGLRAPAEHYDDGRVLAVSLSRLATEASRHFGH